jgi:hypothetical protein
MSETNERKDSDTDGTDATDSGTDDEEYYPKDTTPWNETDLELNSK